VVATLTFEKVLILGRVAAFFYEFTPKSPGHTKLMTHKYHQSPSPFLFLFLVPLFFILTRRPGCHGPG
jgi:hypothetical protein